MVNFCQKVPENDQILPKILFKILVNSILHILAKFQGSIFKNDKNTSFLVKIGKNGISNKNRIFLTILVITFELINEKSFGFLH